MDWALSEEYEQLSENDVVPSIKSQVAATRQGQKNGLV